MTITPLYDVIAPSPGAVAVPLLVDLPHSGVSVPDDIRARLTAAGRALPDTDWHLEAVYRLFVPDLGGRMLVARNGRYVVDLNRPADGDPLYPGRDETGLVPTSTFANEPLYDPGNDPDADEIARRAEAYWRPYHARLRAELDALVDRFGYALLWDGHSIRGHVPRFAGDEILPDLMLGDFDGRACPATISDAVLGAVESTWSGSVVRNHLFRGGFITRNYGDAGGRVLALQMEMSQRIYMQEQEPFPFDEPKAARLRDTLRAGLSEFIAAGARHFGA